MIKIIILTLLFPGLLFAYDKQILTLAGGGSIKPEIFLAMAYVESSKCKRYVVKEGCLDPYAVSNKDAVGILQILPSTAKYVADMNDILDYHHSFDLFDVELNVKLSVFYLYYLYKKYDDIYVAMDAYNRGPGNVQDYPYIGDWKDHSYVGEVLKFLKVIEGKKRCKHTKVKISIY